MKPENFGETLSIQPYLARDASELGRDADKHDVRAYNEAYERAWQAKPPRDDDEARRLGELVLEGDHPGCDWVTAANLARGEISEWTVVDYRTGEPLSGTASLELIKQSLAMGDVGAVNALLTDGVWQYVPTDQSTPGTKVVYVEQGGAR